MLSIVLLGASLAFAAGWYLAHWVARRRSRASSNELSSDYFRGLNYLLNEQPDKAIEVFLKLAEYNRDAVETHLALGSLFRRRGETDRAIRLHQHLVSRPGLSDELKTLCLMELGEDYMRAGLLDRAETLFSDLVAMQALAPAALRQLISIYQHERDWPKAIEHARELERIDGESAAALIAQFYCELAEQARQRDDYDAAREHLREAFKCENDAIRALLLSAELDMSEHHYDKAVATYEHALTVDVCFVPGVLAKLQDAYVKSRQTARAARFFDRLLERYNGISLVLARFRLYREQADEATALHFLTEQLRHRPSVRGLLVLLEDTMGQLNGEAQANFVILHDLMHQLSEGRLMYRCTRCGYGAKAHHWQCPSCKNWSTIRPVLGVANE